MANRAEAHVRKNATSTIRELVHTITSRLNVGLVGDAVQVTAAEVAEAIGVVAKEVVDDPYSPVVTAGQIHVGNGDAHGLEEGLPAEM